MPQVVLEYTCQADSHGHLHDYAAHSRILHDEVDCHRLMVLLGTKSRFNVIHLQAVGLLNCSNQHISMDLLHFVEIARLLCLHTIGHTSVTIWKLC